MSPGIVLEGYVDDGRGHPLPDIPASAARLSDGVEVDTTLTDIAGHWAFTDLPTSDEYVVTLRDPSGNAVARAPWSGELRSAWVRDRLDVAGKPVVVDPAAGNALLWTATGLYAPTGLSQAAADLRYEPLDSAYTKAEADARYPKLTDLDPYPQYLTPIEADATYVLLTGGSVMTGLLGPTTTNTRDLGTSALRWRALYGMTADLTTSLTVASKTVGVSATGGNTLTWNSDGFYVAAGAVTDIWVDVLGDTMTGVLNMAANILPTTTNTRDLGSTTLRWRKTWAVDGEFTNVPTVGGVALLTQAAADLRYEPLDSMYTKAEDDARFVNLAGGSVMTGLLGPTTTNTRDLGTTTLRWRKLWAVDGEFTNTPTVGGVALPTFTTADAAYVNATSDTMSGTLGVGGLLTASAGLTVTGAATVSGAITAAAKGHLFGAASGTLATGAVATTDANILLYQNTSTNWAGIGTDISGNVWLRTGLSGTPAPWVYVTPTGVVNVTGSLQVNSRPVIMAGCRVTHNAAQSIANTTPTQLAFNTERFDTDNFHDTVTNNSRLTVPAGLGGTYLIVGNVEWANNSTGQRELSLVLNGTTRIGMVNESANAAVGVTVSQVMTVYALVATDYVELRVYQSSTVALNVTVGANYSPEFSLQRIG